MERGSALDDAKAAPKAAKAELEVEILKCARVAAGGNLGDAEGGIA